MHAHPTFEPPIRRLVELYFMRDPHAGNAPFLMINGDLTMAFRRRLGAAVVHALEACSRPEQLAYR